MSAPAKVGSVTCAGGRIGRGIAAMLIDEGYRLIVNDLDPAACERVAGQLSGRGATVLAAPGDVSARADADAAVEMTFGAWGCLDLLVDCAGIFPNTPVVNMEDAGRDRVDGVNLRGPFMLPRRRARHARRRAPGSRRAWNLGFRMLLRGRGRAGRERGPPGVGSSLFPFDHGWAIQQRAIVSDSHTRAPPPRHRRSSGLAYSTRPGKWFHTS